MAEQINGNGDYLRLPDQYDTLECHIMKRFAEAVSEGRNRGSCLVTEYKRSFRRFNNESN